MRKLFQRLLNKPLTWIGNYLAAAPKKAEVEKSLTELYKCSHEPKNNRILVLQTDLSLSNYIIFSDQHKGNRSWADDFQLSERNYRAALGHYNSRGFSFINLGDKRRALEIQATGNYRGKYGSFHFRSGVSA